MSVVPAVLAGDVEAVASLGLAGWREGPAWPVSDANFFGVLDALWRAFTDLHDGLAADASDLVLSDIGFVGGMLVQHLHGLMADAAAEREGLELRRLGSAKVLHHPDWERLGAAFDVGLGSGARWRLAVREHVKGLRFNPLLGGIFMGRHSDVWSLGSQTALKHEYCRRHRLAVRHVYAERLLGDVAIRPLCEVPESALLGFLSGVARALPGAVAERLAIDRLASCWSRRLKGLARHATTLSRLRAPATVLLSESGSPLHRLVALRLRRQGTRVLGFLHGNDMGGVGSKGVGFVEYAVCDQFLAPTSTAARFHAERYRHAPIAASRPVSFESLDSDYYAHVRARVRGLPAGPVRHVALMGFPMTAIRYQYSAASFFAQQLDLAIRVAEDLRRHGYRVTYRAHPETFATARPVLGGWSDALANAPFETEWDSADAYLFTYPTTTTFGFALCTDRPVVLIDAPGQEWNQEARRLVERRCLPVPGRWHEGTRVAYDTDALHAALARRPVEPDPAYVETCMIPAGSASMHQAPAPLAGEVG